MNSETRTCQNCKNHFTIEPEDFGFYEKIQVPPPTWCSECRLIRRLQFRNLRTLYKRKTLDGKEVFSAFAPDSPFQIYTHTYWHSDKLSPASGVEYDFSKPFFYQLKELMLRAPWAAGFNFNSVNSEYCNNCVDLKNCYLSFNTGFSNDCAYVIDTLRSSRCFDALKINQCELSYELFDCEKCYRAFFSSHCRESHDIYFCEDLSNCRNCLGCINMRNKQFCIFNKQYSKEEYSREFSDFFSGSHENLLKLAQDFKLHKSKFPLRFREGFQNENVSGDYVSHSKNCHSVFYSRDLENCAYCQLILFAIGRDAYDMTIAGGELAYELAESTGYKNKFTWYTGTTKIVDLGAVEVEYSLSCFNSSHLFGCVGLKNANYCILNKQYTREEYEKIVPMVIKHMNTMPYVDQKDRVYKYGEFFPAEFSPFAYNESLAQEYFPLTKEEALEKGYKWKDLEQKHYEITIEAEKLPNYIKDVKDTILKETISCLHGGKCNEQCTKAFKIIPQELEFYRNMNLPPPRLCPNCRHYQRLKQRNPLRLWHRQCMCKSDKHFHKNICPNEFETSYAPDGKGIVYCEQCYNAEVV